MFIVPFVLQVISVLIYNKHLYSQYIKCIEFTEPVLS